MRLSSYAYSFLLCSALTASSVMLILHVRKIFNNTSSSAVTRSSKHQNFPCPEQTALGATKVLQARAHSHSKNGRNYRRSVCHWLPRVPTNDCSRIFASPRLALLILACAHSILQYPQTHPSDLFRWYQNASLFAIVRNPYHRMVSEWNYGGDASKKEHREDAHAMNEYLFTSLSKLQAAFDNGQYKWWQRGDHWVRQVDFVSNVADHVYILHYEDLAHEFARLMHTFGRNWTWPSKKVNAARGHLTVANLTGETKRLISTYYALDFEQLGYDVHSAYLEHYSP